MSFRKITHSVASCDSCGFDWWQGITEHQPCFSDQTLARKQLTTQHEWRIDRHSDGRRRMFCATCKGKSDCELYGCDTPHTPEGRMAACIRCGQIQRADRPRGEHPETVSTDMPEWLTALDHELFGEPAALDSAACTRDGGADR